MWKQAFGEVNMVSNIILFGCYNMSLERRDKIKDKPQERCSTIVRNEVFSKYGLHDR